MCMCGSEGGSAAVCVVMVVVLQLQQLYITALQCAVPATRTWFLTPSHTWHALCCAAMLCAVYAVHSRPGLAHARPVRQSRRQRPV